MFKKLKEFWKKSGAYILTALISVFVGVDASVPDGYINSVISKSTPSGYDQMSFASAATVRMNGTQTVTRTGQGTDSTVIVVMPLGSPNDFELEVKIDSMSGSTGGTAYLQREIGMYTGWSDTDTITIDGETTSFSKTGDVLGGTYRLYVVLDTSSQETKISWDALIGDKD